MTAVDWDLVPHPVRALAFLRMLDHWAAVYRLGPEQGVDARDATDHMAAIVIMESWFEHRAVNDTHPGHVDLGLLQATDYARFALARLERRGDVDFAPATDDDYLDPWIATRLAVLWFGLMLDESRGDLAMAVRAYHRGTPAAREGEGVEYLEEVQRRLAHYVRGEATSPTWRFLRRRWRTRSRQG
jgi:hypothetical protein